jgi:hypothetical protein
MSILDRVTKAVGDVVDRGKKELDQFVRIQKINGQIGDLEKNIGESNGQIQQIKVKIGERAIDMLQAGTLASPEMKVLLEQVSGIQQQIASSETEITQKRSEIERIKAEAKPATPPSPPVVDSAIPPPPPTAVPPPPPATDRYCPQCGASASTGAFCPQCGAKRE